MISSYKHCNKNRRASRKPKAILKQILNSHPTGFRITRFMEYSTKYTNVAIVKASKLLILTIQINSTIEAIKYNRVLNLDPI